MDDESLETLEEYLSFILNNNLGVIINSEKELSAFQNKSGFRETPSDIEYLILDIDKISVFDDNLIEQICDIKIKYLQIRFSKEVVLKDIKEVISKIKYINQSGIHEISIVAKYDDELLQYIKENYREISNKFLQFILHSSNEDDFYTLDYVYVTTIKTAIEIPLSCGLIDLKNINLDRGFYLEAKHYNSCLNKKISIDKEGNIKNCPSMPQSFGNIRDTTLENARNHPEFRKYWNLTKDSIEVCRDCEFRYICTDCRAYTEQTSISKGIDTSKPLKCGYDPYTGEWEEWSTNVLKQKAIEHYGMHDFIKNYRKIQFILINKDRPCNKSLPL